MKAGVASPDGVVIKDIDPPKPNPTDMVVQIKAIALNRADLGSARGDTSHGSSAGMLRCLTSRLRCGFERDTIALAFQRLNGPVADPLGMPTIGAHNPSDDLRGCRSETMLKDRMSARYSASDVSISTQWEEAAMPINVTMMLRRALRQLGAERGHIDRQIAALRGALDGLGAARHRRRPSPSAHPVRRRRRMSAAARRAVSQRMRAYWAKRKAARAKRRAKSAKTT